jgi:hypothetical protein
MTSRRLPRPRSSSWCASVALAPDDDGQRPGTADPPDAPRTGASGGCRQKAGLRTTRFPSPCWSPSRC